jgi:hypothetical protein
MTLFANPLLTDGRYTRGLEGVAASLPRLLSVVGGRDRQTLTSVLGDMAFCLDIEAAEAPHCEPDDDALCNLFDELEDAVQAGREPKVRKILRKMLEAMGLTKNARTPRPRKQN